MSDPRGILVCGLNGAGKTTLARELAQLLGYKHMDIEDYYFLPSDIPYTRSRTREECISLMLADMEKHPNFVLSAVIGNFGEEVIKRFDLAIIACAPLDVRLARALKRDFDRFGNRALEGGDLYEQQFEFHNKVAARPADYTEQWVKTLSCSVFRIDATRDVQETAKEIGDYIRGECVKSKTYMNNDNKNTVLYFIRHAESDVSVHDDMTRPLTLKGFSDAEKLVDIFSDRPINRIYASPLLRTIQTVTPLAKARGLSINTIDDLRERKIGHGWIDDFDSYSKQQWVDFTYKLPGGDSLLEVQERNIAAIRSILSDCEGGNIIVATHGTALSTIINYYSPTFAYADYERIKPIMPLVVYMEFCDGNFVKFTIEEGLVND
jgi:2,3-bisphosphoglycerate-dependent phosphoglycerate mutase